MVGHSDWGKWTFLRKTNCAMVAKRENWRFLVARRSLVDKSEGNHDDRLRCILWGRSGGNIGKHQFIYLDNSLFCIKLTGKKRENYTKLQTMLNSYLGSGFLEQKDNRRKMCISFWQEDICIVEEKGEENLFSAEEIKNREWNGGMGGLCGEGKSLVTSTDNCPTSNQVNIEQFNLFNDRK